MKATTYASEAVVQFDQTMLNELCEKSAKKNRELGITGYLSLKRGRFFQYLEGPENAVDELIGIINEDSRHKILRSLDLGPIAKRRFSSWDLLDVTRQGTSNIRIQDLIEDVMNSFFGDKTAEHESRRLILEMLGQMSKLHSDVGAHKKMSRIDEMGAGKMPPFVVVLGASAGGLLPLQSIVRTIKSDLEVVFIIIQHFSPETETMMDMILQRDTDMNVSAASHDVKLEPGNIFVIPPGENLEIVNGRFLLTKQERTNRNPQHPIDICFRSVAREYGDRSVAVVLSGTGSDGSRGAKVLNEAGGVVLVQSPESAEFDGMPKSCIDTGMAHQILPPSEIVEFINGLNNDYVHDSLALRPAQRTDYVSEIVTLLEDSDVDFAHYKNETLFRRIERRRVMADIATTHEYIALLRSSAVERKELREDILISVTSFFRDPDAWDKLTESIFPILTTALQPSETFRVWVAACSTGEEAYTVGIVLTELLEKLGRNIKFKIYATDIERNALNHAGVGVYSERSLNHVSSERRERFFTRKADGYVISNAIRENVIFAPHNFIKNAPFTRMHLVSCRNVLIYMQPELQLLALKMLHFSLHVNGILFLGPSETLGNLQSEFYPVQREWNQFKKLRNLRLPLYLSAEKKSGATTGKPSAVEPLQLKNEARTNGIIGLSLDVLARQTGNTNVVIDRARMVQMVISDPSGLLQVNCGEPTLDVVMMVPEALRAPLTFSITRAFKEHNTVTHRELSCQPAGQQERRVNLQVVPHVLSGEKEAQHALLVFSDAVVATELAKDIDIGDMSVIQMRTELEETKEALQAAINDLESSGDQQRSVNEQLSAANEELQSTNEELQSVNEELYTVNFEYQAKIHELSDLNQDLDNLLDSTNLGVIFLDTELCIRRFTDVATQTVNLLPSDIGRPFVDLAHNLQYKDLIGDMRRVLSIGKTISREIPRNDVDLLQVGIHPYRAGDGVAHGVLIMFRDIKRPSVSASTDQVLDTS